MSSRIITETINGETRPVYLSRLYSLARAKIARPAGFLHWSILAPAVGKEYGKDSRQVEADLEHVYRLECRLTGVTPGTD